MKGQTYIIFALIFALIVAIFAVINVEPVEVDYLFGTGQVPLILVILISVLFGGLITGGFGIFRLIRVQRELRRVKRENEQLTLTEDVNDPITDEQQLNSTAEKEVNQASPEDEEKVK
ncbi:LapA family protein [Paraliobacillus ryukyuensis]|uniref:LapA family protein n=1 Tax=Paraliobacillus ryukyuensis TaxID=200904 RepID=UPI0009A78FE3|nr:lipopolysaccharide assembly protein LapA domain-containing protein [Paraliobacillus ryukyuensis]